MKRKLYIDKQDGFSLVEMMVTLVVFLLAIAAASNIFSGLLNQFKQQSRIAESNIEGLIGLEMFRHDIEQAGNGIPWNLNGSNYAEATGSPAATYNDNPNPPRAVVIGDGLAVGAVTWQSFGQTFKSDELVIKAANIATNAASQKWTHIVKLVPTAPNALMTWGTLPPPAAAVAPTAEDLDRRSGSADYVIVVDPGTTTSQRVLMNDGANFYTQLSNNNFSFNKPSNTTSYGFEPFTDTQNSYVVYGIKPYESPEVPPRMPFNRADYYISVPAQLPVRCATSELNLTNPSKRTTGVLYKSVISHKDGTRSGPLPLIDCVADMQVVALASDGAGGGGIDLTWQTVPATAQDIVRQIREIKVYILAQEGQKDQTFTFTNFTGSPNPPFNNTCPGNCATCIEVGENCNGSIFDLSKISANSSDTNEYLHYRWKVYTIAATPYNIR